MSHTLPTGSAGPAPRTSAGTAPRASAGRALRLGGGIGSAGFTVMIIVLLVAIVFAANANDVIGWLVVAIAAAWLVFAVVVFLQLRSGVKAAGRKVDQTVDTVRADVAALRKPVLTGETVAPAADPMRDTKLDHSFKIVQVQARVVKEQLASGEVDREMVDRALETIHITAANARDMIKGEEGAR